MPLDRPQALAHAAYLTCRFCGRDFKAIAWSHLRTHGLTTEQYRNRYGRCFLLSPWMRAETSKRVRRSAKPSRYKPREGEEELRKELYGLARTCAAAGNKISSQWLLIHEPSLYHQVCHLFGSWRLAKKACKIEHLVSERARRLAAGRKIRLQPALRAWVARHGPLNYTELRNTESLLLSKVETNFKTLERAARRFGLPYREKLTRWTRGLIRQRIHARAKDGKPMHAKAVAQESSGLLAAASKAFGTWDRALRACGIDPSKLFEERKRLRAQEREAWIGLALRKWVARHGEIIYVDLRRTHPLLLNRVEKYFRTVEKAARHFGLPYRSKVRHWTRGLILARLRERAGSVEPMPVSEVQRQDSGLVAAAMKHFGSWENALAAIGIDQGRRLQDRRRRQVQERVASVGLALREWVSRHGEIIYADLRRTHPLLLMRVERYFRTVEKAARHFGLPYRSKLTHWTSALIRARLRLRAQSGAALSSFALREEASGLYRAARLQFGSWTKALDACGLGHLATQRSLRRAEGLRLRAGPALRAWVKRHGPLNYSDLRKTDSLLLGKVERSFGNVESAARKYGLPHRRKNPGRKSSV